MKKVVLLVLPFLLAACSEQVGTKAWCDNLRETPKTEWTADNALDFAKHCVLQDEVGSKTWCKKLKAKPKGDWSANEATAFAQHCIF